MVFESKSQRGVLLFLLGLIVLPMLTLYSSGLIIFRSVLIVFIVLCLFVKFRFKVTKEVLSFEMLIFSKTVYRKKVLPNQIIGMKFKRVGWGKKCVIIQTNKGINLRVINFYPERVYNNLYAYADQHDIYMVKSKDYSILEKVN